MSALNITASCTHVTFHFIPSIHKIWPSPQFGRVLCPLMHITNRWILESTPSLFVYGRLYQIQLGTLFQAGWMRFPLDKSQSMFQNYSFRNHYRALFPGVKGSDLVQCNFLNQTWRNPRSKRGPQETRTRTSIAPTIPWYWWQRNKVRIAVDILPTINISPWIITQP